MDRIDAMKVFVTALDEGSLAGAARRLKRSPTAVSRALTFLESHVGVELLHRTTRRLILTPAGEAWLEHRLPILRKTDIARSERSILSMISPRVHVDFVTRRITRPRWKRHR